VRPWQEDPTRIEVLLEVRDKFPVNTESVAKVASLSALGDNYLEISPGQQSASRIEPGGTIPSVETVTLDDITKKIFDAADTAQSLMKDVQRDFRRISEDAHVLLTNLQELSGEKNQRNIERMLENTNLLLEDLRPKLDQVTGDITVTLKRAQGLALEWEKVAKTADVTIGNLNGTIQDVRDPLKRDLEELEATLKLARELLEDVQALVAVNEDNINESIENFRVASQNIEELTDELRQRPWSLIRVKAKADRQVPIAAGRP